MATNGEKPWRTRISGPGVWSGDEMQSRSDWMHALGDAEKAELLAAVARVRAAGTAWLEMDKDGFGIPRTAALLARISAQLENGAGIALLRGLPHEALGQEGMRIALWGVGLHMGTAVSQSRYGELLGEVRDYGEPMGLPTSRGYRAAGALRFHTDRCDVVVLACVRQGRSGGNNLVVSTPHIHNVLLERDPEALDALHQYWYHSRQGEGQPHEAPWFRNPIFCLHKGRFTSQYSRAYVESADQFLDLPRVTEAQWRVLDLLAELAHSESFLTRMEPGDLQFLNNHVTYHARDAVVDWDEAEKKRMLYRLWLSMPQGRELPADFDELWGPTAAGAVRGGVVAAAGYRTVAELRALRAAGRAPERAGWPLERLAA
ncbi:MAG: TauD/TfdA family dioxygenase [Burkholderiales bacterium]